MAFPPFELLSKFEAKVTTAFESIKNMHIQTFQQNLEN